MSVSSSEYLGMYAWILGSHFWKVYDLKFTCIKLNDSVFCIYLVLNGDGYVIKHISGGGLLIYLTDQVGDIRLLLIQ